MSATGTKPNKGKQSSPRAVPKDQQFQIITLADIVSNSMNVRLSVPALGDFGYGVFERVEGADKPTLMELALSKESEKKAEFCQLIDKHELHIKNLANDISTNSQLNPVQVRKTKSGYDLIAGCRRCLAVAYNSIKNGVEPRIKVVVLKAGDDDAERIAAGENLQIKAMDPIAEGLLYKKHVNLGMKPPEIAKRFNRDEQIVRKRLKLVQGDLSEKERQQVSAGDIPIYKAEALIEARRQQRSAAGKGGSNGTASSASSKEKVEIPIRVQRETTKGWSTEKCRKWYFGRPPGDPEEWTEEVRRFFAAHMCGDDHIVYQPFEAMAKTQART